MTEDEAKGKWCPFSTVAGINAQGSMLRVSISRTRGMGEQPTCIASACTAWITDATAPGHSRCGLIDGGNVNWLRT